VTGRLRSLASLGALAWLLAVTGLAVVATQAQWSRLAVVRQLYPWRTSSLTFVLGLVCLAVTLMIGVRLLRPGWWRRALLALAVLPVPLLLISSDNVIAGCAAVALLGPAGWLGREVAARLLRPIDRPDAWIVGGAAGIGTLAALGYALGRVGLLRPQVIWPTLFLLTLALLVVARRHLGDDISALRRWLVVPAVPPWAEVVPSALLLGYVWLNLIGALAPEVGVDAIRIRLPAAALFARLGRFVVAPELFVGTVPRLGEVIYAVVLASGPLQTAKLVNFVVGLLCAAGVWSLGRRLGGRRAAHTALLAFYTFPMTVWLSQTAYSDLFVTLFGVTTAVLLVLHARPGPWALVGALGCIGAGLAVKTSFGPAGGGLLLILALVLLWRVRVLGPLALALAGGALALATLSFSARLGAAGAVPGFLVGVQFLPHAQGLATILQLEFEQFGSGHTLAALVRSPLDLTLHTARYGQDQDGFAGYLVLALVPLLVLTRPRRRAAMLLVGMLAAYLLWFSTTQYLRYALPIVAILCAIGGAGYAAALRRSGNRAVSVTMTALLPFLGALGLIGYLFTILIYPGDFPYHVVLGQQSKSVYLDENVNAYTAQRLLDAEPGATGAISAFEYPRLYTRVRIVRAFNLQYIGYHVSPDERVLLQQLDQGGFSHIIVDRGLLPPEWENLTVTDEEFLRRNTVLVGGDHNAYLYRILPPDQRGRAQPWADGPELLPDGGFEGEEGGWPRGWSPVGHPTYDTSGQAAHSGRGAVLATPQDALFTTVAVTPGTRYLLSHFTRGAGGDGLTRLQINWRDAAGGGAGVSIEVVPTSPQRYHLFSMLVTAPTNAVAATVYVQAQQGDAWFDDLSLRAVAGEVGQPADRTRSLAMGIRLDRSASVVALVLPRVAEWQGGFALAHAQHTASHRDHSSRTIDHRHSGFFTVAHRNAPSGRGTHRSRSCPTTRGALASSRWPDV